jgi:hypothetical protein
MTYSATKPSADRSHWHHQVYTLYLHHLHKVIVCNPVGICTNGYLQQSKWQPLDIPTRPADFYEWTIGAKASWAAWRRTCGDPEPCKNCCGWLLTKLFQVWVSISPLLLLMLELITTSIASAWRPYKWNEWQGQHSSSMLLKSFWLHSRNSFPPALNE